jgi:hypothetical protein
MLKPLFWVAVGAAGALQADRWLEKRKARFSPHAITGTMLDKVNSRLEKNRSQEHGGRV